LLTRRRQGRDLLFFGVICALTLGSHSAARQTSALPTGWTDRDIGNPSIAGDAQSSADTMTVRGAGSDIGGTSDQFHFAYQNISGDVDVRVRVANLLDVNPGAKAGLMIRDSLTANAKHGFIFLSAEQGLAFQWRTRSGRASTQVNGAAAAAPTWVRLVRQGRTFKAYSSSTGAEWTLVGSATINMSSSTYVGLAVTSHDPSQTTTASFSNPVFGSVPAPWAAGDIGGPAVPGSASEASGTFTVTGSGQDIGSTSDQFQFVYQPVTGDTEIVAFMGSLQAADALAKAGVMIRGALTGSAAHASMFATGSSGWTFQRRLSAGGTSYQTPGPSGSAPGWIRLDREGNLFSAYTSPDGSTWTLVGTDTTTMPATVYVGLAVTSHNASATATATFSNIAISTPSSNNNPPTVSISSPASGASYTAPASIAINATAGDADGSVTRVDFYAGSQQVGSDTTSPFSTTWSNVAAGTYSLTAVATDNGGLTTTSSPISVTVRTNQAPTVSISSPTSGASYTAPASITISATAGDTDGTVSRVDFYAGSQLVGSDTTSPFSISWNNVAAATYSLTAVATDNGGATTTSGPISVTVGAAPVPIQSATLYFDPPLNYSTSVNSCTLELHRAADGATVATSNLGKPAVVSGQISVDITALVSPLPAGSYYSVVIAIGPGGSTPGSPSPVFTR
jgi:regulation of enolase protein 1 (concanavalin A-like superfamily)